MASKWQSQDSTQGGLAQAPPEQPPEGPYKCPHLSQIHSLRMCWAACPQVRGLLSGVGEQGRAQGLGHSLQVPAEGWTVTERLPTLTMCSSLQGAESDWHHRLHPDRDLCLPGSHPAGEALHPLPGPCPSEQLLA